MLNMEILKFSSITSTQEYLIENIKNGNIKPPKCILSKRQTKGVGSRGDVWLESNKGLYFSFCLDKSLLPSDLKIQSLSIFFGVLFKVCLNNIGSKAWLKWPNDLYLNDKKIGGVLCNILGSVIVCGIGLNIRNSTFGNIEDNIMINEDLLLKKFFLTISNNTWKSIFDMYKMEFYKNYNFSFTYNGNKVSFNNVKLLSDGAILLSNNEVIYSNR